MDVETTMKLNAFAKELLEKGIASSSDEAAKMAESMMHKEILPKADKVDDVKYDILIERLGRQVNNEINALKEQMQSLSNQIEMIHSQVKSMGRDKVVVEEKKPVEEQKKIEKDDDHPRQGEFKPGDSSVDINNIFYYGDKKK